MRNNKLTPFLLIAFVAILFTHCANDARALNKKLSEIAAKLNESTPIMLDNFTRFDHAEVTKNNVFRYHYTVINTDDPKQLIDEHCDSMKDEIKLSFATNPDLRIFVKNNVPIEYIYKDEKGNIIKNIPIHPSDYK